MGLQTYMSLLDAVIQFYFLFCHSVFVCVSLACVASHLIFDFLLFPSLILKFS